MIGLLSGEKTYDSMLSRFRTNRTVTDGRTDRQTDGSRPIELLYQYRKNTEWMTFAFDTTVWSRQISYKHHKRHKMILINNDSRLPSVRVGLGIIARRDLSYDRAAQSTAACTAGWLSFGHSRQVLRRNFVTISSTARSSFIFHCYDYHRHSTKTVTNELITVDMIANTVNTTYPREDS